MEPASPVDAVFRDYRAGRFAAAAARAEQLLGDLPDDWRLLSLHAACRQALGDDAAAVASYPGGHNEGYDDSFKQSFRSFYGRLCQHGEETLPAMASFAEGHREVAVCEAILASDLNRVWADVV